MVLKRAQGAIARRRRGLSLRAILVVPFVLQLCLAVGVTHWLSWRNGQQTVENLAFSLQGETGQRIQLKLANYLDQLVLINRLNADAVRAGQLDLKNLAAIEADLLRQLMQFEGIRSIQVANAAGEMRSVSRAGSPSLLGSAPDTTPKKSAEYLLNQGKQSQSLPQQFDRADIRRSPWYSRAVATQGLVWTVESASSIALPGKAFPNQKLPNQTASNQTAPNQTLPDAPQAQPISETVLRASLPVYDSQDSFAGVFTCTVALAEVEQFLQGLSLSEQGGIFILDTQGEVIASAGGQQVTGSRSGLGAGSVSSAEAEPTGDMARDAPADTPGSQAMDAALAMLRQQGQSSAKFGSGPRLVTFLPEARGFWDFGRDRYFLSLIPYRSDLGQFIAASAGAEDPGRVESPPEPSIPNLQKPNSQNSSQEPPAPLGLDWRIVIATPERAFTREMNHNTRNTLALSSLALLGAIALGLATANWLARPIMRLSRASQAIAHGDLDQTLLAESLDEQAPIREVASLARSFNQMTQRLRRAFDSLETRVDRRTRQLQQSFEFEATLKRLTDRVRDSLDEDEILHRAVEELAIATGVKGCNAAIYDLEQQTATVKYEYTTFPKRLQGSVLDMGNFAGYSQLLAGQYFQHCGTIAVPSRGQVAMLACPMLDDQGVLGDLWLIKPAREAFNDQEIRLVQQVANQCAIAIRQARLYQAAQTQVNELARLNQLKDDFLSTVSHELRTPMANMKMALQMLDISRQRQAQAAAAVTPASEAAAPDPSQRYFAILKEAVQRESTLIENLLDLSRLDIQSAPPQLSTIEPRRWLRQVVEPYYEKTGDRLRWQLFLPDYLPLLQTDANYLKRILMELLDNACKYTPDGECITVSVQLEQSWLSFSVGNSGVEIPPAEQRRIFERFYRIPTSDPWKHGGTGLGLALVRQLSERLGGQVEVESSNHHSLFTVSFPLTLDNGAS